MTQKLSQETVEEQFEARGFKLLDVYKNNTTPLKFICSCGRKSTISYKSFKRGSKCFGCSGKKKKTKNQIIDALKKEGYQFLSGEYKNAFSLFAVECPEGHKFDTFWNNWQQGRRCPVCKPNIIGNKLRSTQDEVREFFKKEGCELLSDYQSNHKPIKYKCKCGSVSRISFANFKIGHRCQQCRVNNMSGPNHPLWIEDREEAEKRKKFVTKCHSALRCTYKALGHKKDTRSFKLLGYTPTDLREHIESHPDWPKVKDDKWHLDHIFPIKTFCDYGITNVGLINSLDNLRPMKGKENLSKSAKYNKGEFEKWLLVNGVEIGCFI